MVLQRYLTRLLLAYARRYIRGLAGELQLSFWQGDVVLHDLDLRLDVLHRVLGLPRHMHFTRGFVRVLRIHIPWTALTTRPVEVTLEHIECVVQASVEKEHGQSESTD